MNQNFYDKLKNALCNSDIDFLQTHRDKYDINHCFADEDNDSLLLYAMSDKGSSAYKYLLEKWRRYRAYKCSWRGDLA